MAKIRDLPGCCDNEEVNFSPARIKSEYEYFKSLLFNTFKITNVTYAQEQRIKNLLISNNYVGYDKLLNIWTTVAAREPFNNENLPLSGDFYIPSLAKTITRVLTYAPAKNGSYRLQGLPGDISFSEIIKSSCDLIKECDEAIIQNLRATKTPEIIVTDDPKTRLSILHAIKQQQNGSPVVIVSAQLREAIKGIPLNTPYIVDRLYTFRQQVRDALYNKLAIMTANIDKRERVQATEVNAVVGQCEDNIYMFLDNLNRQCESYGLSQRFLINNSLEELYTNNATTAPNFNKENTIND